MKALSALIVLGCALAAQAQPQPPVDPGARIALERAQLQAEREQAERAHDARARECWQRFAVNDCLREVRRSRRAALDPIRARELALNAEERAWRTRQREERLQDKASPGKQRP